MPKKWSLMDSTENTREHHISWERLSHSPHGHMQLKERLRNKRKVLVGSWLHLVYQWYFGITGLESYKRPNTTHSIYKLNREVPETVMSRNVSEISRFCEFECLKWVIIQDETAPYPVDHIRLGRYLIPSIDIGLAMMAKIIKENTQVLYG